MAGVDKRVGQRPVARRVDPGHLQCLGALAQVSSREDEAAAHHAAIHARPGPRAMLERRRCVGCGQRRRERRRLAGR
eukprot:scaffold25253_cov118-Isochrysis_galbana.AAC.1